MQLVSHCVLLLLSCFLISFVGSSLTKSEENPQFRLDYEYYGEANGWFKFHEVPATWESAMMKCFYEGAVLASPITDEVHCAMQQTMDNYFTYIFTGIQSLTSTGDYFSIEGVHLMEMPIQWASGQPDNQGDKERCLAMKSDGTVLDVLCTEPRPYICYKNKTEDLVMNSCGTSDKEYVEIAPGHCYKYHLHCEDWWRAHMICSSEGGHLAVINSDSEAQLLDKLFNGKHQKNPCNSHIEKGPFNLGFRNPYGKDRGTSDWLTVQGETIEKAGYTKWSFKNEAWKKNYPSEEHCGWGFFAANTIWIDDALNCTRRLPFFCEIDTPRKPYTRTSTV